MNKHDAECLRRREVHGLFLCTCGCSDTDVVEFEDLRRDMARKAREAAAAHPDPNEAHLLEMCADNLSVSLRRDA